MAVTLVLLQVYDIQVRDTFEQLMSNVSSCATLSLAQRKTRLKVGPPDQVRALPCHPPTFGDCCSAAAVADLMPHTRTLPPPLLVLFHIASTRLLLLPLLQAFAHLRDRILSWAGAVVRAFAEVSEPHRGYEALRPGQGQPAGTCGAQQEWACPSRRPSVQMEMAYCLCSGELALLAVTVSCFLVPGNRNHSACLTLPVSHSRSLAARTSV